jgi:hypothetical protein
MKESDKEIIRHWALRFVIATFLIAGGTLFLIGCMMIYWVGKVVF